VAMDTARWVYTFTNLQPFQVINSMSKIMLKRSQSAAHKEGLFEFPVNKREFNLTKV
jgi:hypothetical protein